MHTLQMTPFHMKIQSIETVVTVNGASGFTFMDPWKPEVTSGAWDESASPAWQGTPAMNTCGTENTYDIERMTCVVDQHCMEIPCHFNCDFYFKTRGLKGHISCT